MLSTTSLASKSASNDAKFIPKNLNTNGITSEKSVGMLSTVKGLYNAPIQMSAIKSDVKNAKHLPYPKIGQFYNLVHTITQGKGHGEIPRLEFHGTVKLHGTNGAVAHDYLTKNTWTQSRNKVLTEGSYDNKNFAAYVNSKSSRPVFNDIFNLIDEYRCNGESKSVVYGEWCGKGIQNNVAVSNLPPMFIVFNIGLFKNSGTCRWLNHNDVHDIITKSRGASEFAKDLPIFSAEEFNTWDITIDFNSQDSINGAVKELTRHTIEVERECPVGKKFDVSGVGEGIVYTSLSKSGKQFMFKVKGEKHSETNGKDLVPVHPEKFGTTQQFVESVTTENRLANVLGKLDDSEKNVKKFCLEVKKDIFKEEELSIFGSNLNKKNIAELINEIAGEWFLNKCS